MQPVNNQQLFFLAEVKLILASLRLLELFGGQWVCLREGAVKPLLELLTRRENSRKQEVKQGPQLTQVVLQRGSRQQNSVG